MEEQARKFGAEFENAAVNRHHAGDDHFFKVHTDKGTHDLTARSSWPRAPSTRPWASRERRSWRATGFPTAPPATAPSSRTSGCSSSAEETRPATRRCTSPTWPAGILMIHRRDKFRAQKSLASRVLANPEDRGPFQHGAAEDRGGPPGDQGPPLQQRHGRSAKSRSRPCSCSSAPIPRARCRFPGCPAGRHGVREDQPAHGNPHPRACTPSATCAPPRSGSSSWRPPRGPSPRTPPGSTSTSSRERSTSERIGLLPPDRAPSHGRAMGHGSGRSPRRGGGKRRQPAGGPPVRLFSAHALPGQVPEGQGPALGPPAGTRTA